MEHFGFDRFPVVGHDRGGRVAHRMALDHPDQVMRIAVLDIIPTYYLYTPNLDHLSNDAENFGGLMTEVHLCRSVNPDTKACGT